MFLLMRKIRCLDDFWCFSLAFIVVVKVIVIMLVIYHVCIANLGGTPQIDICGSCSMCYDALQSTSFHLFLQYPSDTCSQLLLMCEVTPQSTFNSSFYH